MPLKLPSKQKKNMMDDANLLLQFTGQVLWHHHLTMTGEDKRADEKDQGSCNVAGSQPSTL